MLQTTFVTIKMNKDAEKPRNIFSLYPFHITLREGLHVKSIFSLANPHLGTACGEAFS